MARLTVLVKATLMAVVGAAALWTVSAVPRASGPTINLTPFSTAFNSPIGIDFFEPVAVAPGSGSLLASAFYPTGNPNNFQLIDALGAHTVFAPGLKNLLDEIKIATVRDGGCTGGFAVGTAFSGNGVPGQILKVNPDGTFVNPWATLPGETAHIRGSLYQDRACAVGGDLVVVTGNEQNGDPANDNVGNVWRVNSAGVPMLVAMINRHLEGVITVPSNPTYGPLAGNIIAGDEDLVPPLNRYGSPSNGRLWVITPGGDLFTVGAAAGIEKNYPTAVPLHIEDIDLIPQPRTGFASPEGDLFAVDFGGNQILRAPASDFADKCGQILLTQEFPNGSTPALPSGFSTLAWDGAKFVVTPLQNTGSAVVGHYEHVTFWGGTDCPTTRSAPGVTIVKYTNDADANDPNAAGVPNIAPGGTVTWTYKVTNTGNTSVPQAQVVVTDNTTGVTPTFTSELSGNGDTIFDPNEVWLYTATGTALDLTLPPPTGTHTMANSCTAGGTQPPRTAYTNVGRVTIPGAFDTDPSSYCNPPSTNTKSISIGPSSMEGAIKISSGDWVNGGYSFKTNFTGNITISATVSLTGKCIGGSLPSDTMTFSLGSVAYAAVAGADWKPTGDANSILSWEGSTVAPASLCGGGQLDASKGAVYNATISGAPTGGLVTFRFKYRDPASKGKPNTNCLNASDPNRAKADVCGASWSATKVDP